jgi:uncharacterized membrane-anchored protein YhcB (DUF1043 family)
MKELLYIALGWLLGLLSHTIVMHIGRKYKKNDLKTAILSDLKNLAVRLAAVYGKIDTHFGTRNKASLEYLKTIYEKYRDKCPQDIIDGLNKLIKSDKKNIAAVNAYSKAEENISLSFRKYSLYFIEAVSGEFSLLPIEFQREILEIRTQLNIYNELVDSTTFFYHSSFNAECMKNNSNIIKSNLENTYKEIQNRCKIITDKISNSSI